MNLTQLQDECGRLLGDPNHDRWSASTLTTRINLAQTEIEGYTSAVKTSEVLTMVTGTADYSLNASTMNIIRAYKTLPDGSIKPLDGITREKLDYLYPDWEQWTNGEVLFFLYNGSTQTATMVPPPNTGSITSVTMFETRVPADLANSTDIPFDSNNQMIPYHYAIVHWVVAHCFMDDGTPEALGKAKFHRSGNMLNPGEYEKELGRILAEFDSPTAIPSQILFRPQGGRTGLWYIPSKSTPLSWG